MSDVSALPLLRRRKASSHPTVRLTYNRGSGFKIPLRKLSAEFSADTYTIRKWIRQGMPNTSIESAQEWIELNQSGFYEKKRKLSFVDSLAAAFGVHKKYIYPRLRLGMPYDNIPAALAWWQKRWDSIHRKKKQTTKRIFLTPIEQACSCCFKTFFSKHRRKYCSIECSGEAKRMPPRVIGICQTCGGEIFKKQGGAYQFCSQPCYRKSLIGAYPWEQQAADLYTTTNLGLKKVAQKIGAPWQQVRTILRRRGLMDFERSELKRKSEIERRKKFGLGKRERILTVEFAEKLMFEEFKRERHKLKKHDEANHWRSHPVANSESFRIKYRSDLNFQSYVKSQASKQWRLKKEDTEFRKRRTAQHRVWKSKNKDHVKSSQRQWLDNNPEKRKSYRRARHVKEKLNPIYRIRKTLRNRLSKMLNGKANTVGKSAMFGCTSGQLREHLQNKFRRGMTWQNYGTYWQVDHILPCAAFDHTDIQQVKICWNWQNLRPLESDKNLEKSDTITEPQQHLPLCLA